MKKLKVPFVPDLKSLYQPQILDVFENHAQREAIDVINWDIYPYKPVAAVDIMRNEQSLFLHYFVRGNSLKALYTANNSPVHLDSCVEFFMKKENSPYYMNFEFNCVGTCHTERHTTRSESTPISEEEYHSIVRVSSVTEKSFEEKKGIYSWDLCVEIPFKVMGLDAQHLPEKIWGNFYKCGDDTANPHFVSWNPIDLKDPDFHCPQFFGEIFL